MQVRVCVRSPKVDWFTIQLNFSLHRLRIHHGTDQEKTLCYYPPSSAQLLWLDDDDDGDLTDAFIDRLEEHKQKSEINDRAHSTAWT